MPMPKPMMQAILAEKAGGAAAMPPGFVAPAAPASAQPAAGFKAEQQENLPAPPPSGLFMGNPSPIPRPASASDLPEDKPLPPAQPLVSTVAQKPQEVARIAPIALPAATLKAKLNPAEVLEVLSQHISVKVQGPVQHPVFHHLVERGLVATHEQWAVITPKGIAYLADFGAL